MNFMKVVTSIFILIGIFFFLTRGRETALIIDTLAENATAGIRALQGRG